jgi:hypothetical protein
MRTCSCTDGRWGIAQLEVEALIKYAGARAEFFLVSNNMIDEINEEAFRLGGRPRLFIATKDAVAELGEDVIFALGNDGARLLKNHFGDDPECPRRW